MRLVCYSLRSGIWKNLAKMSEETIPHAILLCRDTTLAVSSTYTKQNERHIVSIPLPWNFPDFDLRIKQKRFLYIRPFLLVEHCKDSFFVQYDALVMSIISSKIRKLGLSRRKDTGKEKEKREFHPLISIYSSKIDS